MNQTYFSGGWGKNRVWPNRPGFRESCQNVGRYARANQGSFLTCLRLPLLPNILLRETLQELAVKKFAQGNDVFVNLPTGSGKSACFCITPPLFDALRNEPGSIAIVVSPLVALMKDQVEAMKKRGISAVYVRESSGHNITTKICSGTFQLVYLSPESLLTNDTWRDMLQTPTYQQHLAALVID